MNWYCVFVHIKQFTIKWCVLWCVYIPCTVKGHSITSKSPGASSICRMVFFSSFYSFHMECSITQRTQKNTLTLTQMKIHIYFYTFLCISKWILWSKLCQLLVSFFCNMEMELFAIRFDNKINTKIRFTISWISYFCIRRFSMFWNLVQSLLSLSFPFFFINWCGNLFRISIGTTRRYYENENMTKEEDLKIKYEF